jgi:hypothetical protein
VPLFKVQRELLAPADQLTCRDVNMEQVHELAKLLAGKFPRHIQLHGS